MLDLVANPVRVRLNHPLTRSHRRELEYAIFRCYHLLLRSSASGTIADGKGESFTASQMKSETCVTGRHPGLKSDRSFGGRLAIRVKHHAAHAMDFG